MSEYQYYEFQAVDRPLTAAEQAALRQLSTRARITSTSFVNSYEWGSFRGDPGKLMESYFDLHLYLANWGTRHLSMRFPAKLVDRTRLGSFLDEDGIARIRRAGGYVIVDITREEVEAGDSDGEGWLASLAPLREDVLAGDLRMFYLIWLAAVADDIVGDDQPEPMAGCGPLTAPLEAFSDFFAIDRDLLEAGAAVAPDETPREPARDEIAAAIASLGEAERTALLVQFHSGDPHARHELRARLRPRQTTRPDRPLRTAGEIRSAAKAVEIERQRAQARREAKRAAQEAAEQERARRIRVQRLAGQGEAAWTDVEAEIGRRNAKGYENATALLDDLRALAESRAESETFRTRLAAIRRAHQTKRRFIEALDRKGLA